MQQALAIATHSIGVSDPNPRVGCVIADPQGRMLGQGHTQQAGGPHAEIMALRDAAARGQPCEGATAYVSLEPCSHHGRTPPCCDALLTSGIKRVVAAVRDPNPLVAGRGLHRLQQDGVSVEVGLLSEQAIELNIGFFSRMQRGRPWVRLKSALSLDGRSALDNGLSQWITGPAARTDGHLWRRRAGAILTGVGTVLADDPRLDVREVATALQPLRVIIDSKLDTPLHARILRPPGRVLVYAAAPSQPRTEALSALGVEVKALPGPDGKVDLNAALLDLAMRGVNELHVEGGHRLGASFIRERLVDEYLLYLAPKLLGGGERGLASWGKLSRLDEGIDLVFHEVTCVGKDLRILARPAAHQLPFN